jgi:hypothetical protein
VPLNEKRPAGTKRKAREEEEQEEEEEAPAF